MDHFKPIDHLLKRWQRFLCKRLFLSSPPTRVNSPHEVVHRVLCKTNAENGRYILLKYCTSSFILLNKQPKNLWYLLLNRRIYIFKNTNLKWCKSYPANTYLFKVNNRNTRKRYKICSKLKIKTPERRQWRRSVVFILNLKYISHLFLGLLLLTLNK